MQPKERIHVSEIRLRRERVSAMALLASDLDQTVEPLVLERTARTLIVRLRAHVMALDERRSISYPASTVGRRAGGAALARQARDPRRGRLRPRRRRSTSAESTAGPDGVAPERLRGALMPPERYSHVRRALCRHPWAIHPDGLSLMLEIVNRRIAGDPLTADERLARIAARQAEIAAARARTVAAASSDSPGLGIAVLPLYSVISNRMYLLEDVSSCGTSAEAYGKAFSVAMRDPNVGAIILDCDSPGGSVYGIAELGDLIHEARGVKPVVAVASAWAASAAYWIACQADELVVTPSGEVGSLGVIAMHEDISAAAEQAGVKVTLITAGKYKAEGNPFEPLGDEARDQIQRDVDRYYEMFAKAVARGRKGKATPKAVRGEQFGEGRMVGAVDAVNAGMADSIETLDQVIERLAAGLTKGRGRGGSRASASLLGAPVVFTEAVDTDARPVFGALGDAAVAVSPAVEPCATCDHPRADHPDDGPCTVDGCDCEAYAPAEGDGAKAASLPCGVCGWSDPGSDATHASCPRCAATTARDRAAAALRLTELVAL